ncbi:MAG TPA: hypothetical protein VM029_08845 [Opitutaceae bacterium]|nr:hypothetical protein [Opitutaceae bacterium]
MNMLLRAAITVGVLSGPTWVLAASAPAAAAVRNRTIHVAGDDLQGAIDRAQPFDIVVADPNHEIVVHKSVTIDKPLTLLGLRAKLADGLGGAQLLIVTGDDFHLADFHLTGNSASIEQKERAALVQIRGDRFVVERGIVKNSSKDGVEITIAEGGHDVRDGIIRDIVGYDNVRDHISISGLGSHGLYIRNLVVENIRAYRSRSRGAVEVSDGTENITVRDVYAEGCVYGIDVQDHKRAGEMNIGVRLSNVFARNCKHAIRTDNQASTGHRDLTLRNISGSDWPKGAFPIQVSNTRNVVIDDIRLADGTEIDTAIYLRNCHNVTLRAATLERLSSAREAIRLEDSSEVRMRDLYLDVKNRAGTHGAIAFLAQSGGTLRNFDAQGITALGDTNRIVLGRKEGGMENYRIRYPTALIDDGIKGKGARIGDD